jgi:hypothetical protein
MSESAVRAYAAEKRFAAALLSRWLAQPRPIATRRSRRDAVRLANQLRDVPTTRTQSAATPRHCAVPRTRRRAALPRLPVQRRHGARTDLRRLRFPQLSAAEQRLADLARALALPRGVRVELPDNLEGEQIGVTLRAGSAAELRAQTDALAAALRGGAIDEMFAVLEGSA